MRVQTQSFPRRSLRVPWNRIPIVALILVVAMVAVLAVISSGDSTPFTGVQGLVDTAPADSPARVEEPQTVPSPVMIPIKQAEWEQVSILPGVPNQEIGLTDESWETIKAMVASIQLDAPYLTPSDAPSLGFPTLVRAVADGDTWFVVWEDHTCAKECDERTGAGEVHRSVMRLFYSMEAGKPGTWHELAPPSEYGLTELFWLRGTYANDGVRVIDEGTQARFGIVTAKGRLSNAKDGPVYETVIVKSERTAALTEK